MAKQTLSLQRALSTSLQQFPKHLEFFIPMGIIMFLLNAAPSFISDKLGESMKDSGSAELLVSIGITILSFIITVGWYRGLLRIASGKKTTLAQVFSNITFKKILQLVLTQLVAGFLVIVGLILFVIPGIYFLAKYMFAGWLVVEHEGYGSSEALKKSA